MLERRRVKRGVGVVKARMVAGSSSTRRANSSGEEEEGERWCMVTTMEKFCTAGVLVLSLMAWICGL